MAGLWHKGCNEAAKKLQQHASFGSLLMKDGCNRLHIDTHNCSYAYQWVFLRHRHVTNETKYSPALTVQINKLLKV